jgi:hypothetical protein
VAANNVDMENTAATGDVLTAGDTVTAGGAVNETTLEDTSKTVTTTTSTSSTSTKFSGPDIKQAALDTVANAVGEVGANKIGDLKADGLDTVTHKALHAANGAVQGAIKSGGELDGAAAGAIGAAVGEIVAEVVDDGTATRTNEKGQQVTKVASIAAQIAAGLAGKDTDIAAGAATNAVENNRMLHTKEILALKKLAPEYAEKEGISEEEAFQKLISQALRDVDDVYYDSHAQWDKSAQEYLLKNATGTVEIAGRNVLMFTSGGADFKANATLLSETWSQYKDEYLQSVQTPIYTADEKFKTQKQVLDAYLTTISMMPGGAIVEMTTRYEQAVREGDAKTVAEIEQSIPLEVLTAIIPSALKKAGEAVVAGGKKLFKKGDDVAGAGRELTTAEKGTTVQEELDAIKRLGDPNAGGGATPSHKIIAKNGKSDNAINEKTADEPLLLENQYKDSNPPEHPDFPISSGPAPEGKRGWMAVDERQINPKTGQVFKPGAFLSDDPITSVNQVRQDLAVRPDWKKNPSYVQEYKIVPKTQIQQSTVGPQTMSDGTVLPGGGKQTQILPQKGLSNTDVLIPVGPARPIE